ADLTPRENGTVRAGALTLRWQHATASPDLDLNRALGTTENAVAYAVAVFTSPRAEAAVELRFASDDAARVWLNGRQVWTVNTTRGVDLDEDTVPGLSLRAGRNVLVVKVVQGVGGWGTAARFTHNNGTPLRDLHPSR